jgi:hypothetical protein
LKFFGNKFDAGLSLLQQVSGGVWLALMPEDNNDFILFF